VTLCCHGLLQPGWFRARIARFSYRDQGWNAVLGERLAESHWVKSILLTFSQRQFARSDCTRRDGEGCQLDENG
jgi:hypothetical protein